MTKQKGTIRFWLLFVALLIGGGVIRIWERAGEAKVPRLALKEFPAQVGSWTRKGEDIRFDAETEKILRADDYLLRSFQSSSGSVASLYVGYYPTQRQGASYHSPLNCLPGSGWTMSEGSRVSIVPAAGSAPFQVNRYIVENGKERALMLYWYQGRGRAEPSEYWAKIYTTIDSVRLRRSDGAMVRVMVPINNDEAAAQASAVELSALVAAKLPAFVPN